MAKSIKSKIYNMIDEIKDEAVLQMVMEDIAVYTSGKDITDELSPDQQKNWMLHSWKWIKRKV